MATKFDTLSHTYLYNHPCGLWNEECHHGCGYIHLSSSTGSTKKKCCANGALSSVSHNFDEELKMRFGMDEVPLFMRLATKRRKFCQDCTKYNNLFAMATTKVCNYCDNSGFTNQGLGHHCVTLNGRVHHFFTRVSSSNPQSCGLSYFVFGSLASRACLSKSGNVDKELLNYIGDGLKNENPYCKDLQQLGIRVRQGGLIADANVVPRMVDQPPRMAMSVCAVMNCRWTGVMSLQVTTTMLPLP